MKPLAQCSNTTIEDGNEMFTVADSGYGGRYDGINLAGRFINAAEI